MVLVDLSTDFLHNREGRPGQLVVLGAAITKNAAARYGITVSAVYWQVNDQIQGFETSRPDAQHSGGGAETPGLPLPHRKHDHHPTAEEFAAFEAARQEGHALQLGNRVYFAYGTSAEGALQIVDRQKLLTGPKAPTAVNLNAPEISRLWMSPNRGGHTAFPVLGMKIADWAPNTKGNVRDFVVLVSEAIANECKEFRHA